MKRLILTGLFAVSAATLTTSYAQAPIQITKRLVPTVTAKTALVAKPFDVGDAKSSDGKKFTETDVIKTISGKQITVAEYLKRANRIEADMNKKGYSLRNFSLGSSNLIFRPVIVDQAKLVTINSVINKNVGPLPSQTKTANGNIIFQTSSLSPSKFSPISRINPDLLASISARLARLSLKPDSIEQVFSINNLLKPLADKINAEMDNDDADFKLTAADMVIRSYAEPPKSLVNSTSPDIIGETNSEYKVSVGFGASVKVSAGLPITINVPLATMNGEFISPSNKNKKLSRKVVVNLVGRSLFNKTAVVNTNTLDEDDSQELDISELVNSVPLNTMNFMDWIPSIGFNTDVSTSGAVGCMYSAHMTRSSVDAYIGPTYSVRLRVAASYGLEDVAEGGIEGIITLLQGGLGFGGITGLNYDGSQWQLENKAHVISTLEALKGEVDFFVRYPDLLNWSCFGPCIKKETLPIFKTPTAFTLTGTLVDKDKSKTLTW